MNSALLTFGICSGIIAVAGPQLAKFADQIAEIMGWSRLLVGGVLLAGITSLPELSVGVTAIRLNMPDLAVGTLLGSSLMNLMIVALLVIVRDARSRKGSAIFGWNALTTVPTAR